MKRKYVLITPVHNEEQFIGQVIECVIAQTVLPEKWIIVDDESDDKTNEIIERYAKKHNFIEIYKLKRVGIKSYYSRRTEVFLEGYERVRLIEHDFVASLDGDLTFPRITMKVFYENLKVILSLV